MKMEEKETEIDTKKLSDVLGKVVNIGKKIIVIYFLFLIVLFIYYWNNHPEFFNTINKRPVRDGISLTATDGFTYPEWMYEASTMEECKPLVTLQKYFDRFLYPLCWFMIMLGLISLLKWGIDKYANKIPPA